MSWAEKAKARSVPLATLRRALLVLLIAPLGCAGYQVGTQSLYPAHIRTVYVLMFDSSSFRRNLGERLTEAVMKEIELKTPYKVVADAEAADSYLSGRISSETKRVVVEDPNDDPREVEVNLQVEVSWSDHRGSVIRQSSTIPLPSSTATVSASASLMPEVGRSVTTAHQQAIQRAAEQIVAMMEAPW